MKYAAVVFDLFGTLVDNFSRQEYEGMLTGMAKAGCHREEAATRQSGSGATGEWQSPP